MPLRIGVIGTGHLGRFHAKLVSEVPQATLVGVADPVEEACQRVAKECNTRAFADFREMLPLIDAAIVATPTRFHHAVGMQLLNSGIHLLMEKPLALCRQECDELVELAAKNALTLQVGHIERFNPALAQAMPYIREPKYIEAARYSGYTFRSMDIGVVMDLMIHDLDVAMALVGSPVESVAAVGLPVIGTLEDVAQARLTFANGSVANLSASRCSYHPARTMQVWSSCGHVSIDYSTRSAVVAQPAEILRSGEFSPESLPMEERARLKDRIFEELIPLHRIEVDARNSLFDEQHDFVESILQGREPRVSGSQGRDVVAVAEQILQAIAANQWNVAATDAEAIPANTPPSILRGPHWQRSPQVAPAERKRPA
ncbi:MAG: Gfo/Idh/MocA family oxidoreductase [Planctomycetota bacterium]|nr:Gfo/Idh/MocA family oxidoreductase [Planctomycetota bacterium]